MIPFKYTDRAPRSVKLFANGLNMDFDDAESRLPTVAVELEEDQKELKVLPTKFNRVSSLVVSFHK